MGWIMQFLRSPFFKITHFKWSPWYLMTCCNLTLKLFMVLCNKSGVSLISCKSVCILYFRSWIVCDLVWYTLAMRCSHKKKSGAVRSGVRAGQLISSNQEILHFEKKFLNNCSVCLAVWDVASSCWNQMSSLFYKCLTSVDTVHYSP